jgi:lipoprotein-releasing system ATP-binding protein
MRASSPLLWLDKISKDFAPGEGAPVVRVLREVSLEVAGGDSLAIIGPSGSGKSTLLNIIGTLDQPSSGRVLLEGRDLASLDPLEVATLRNRQIGLVFQSHHLLPHCTVWENVLVPTLAERRRPPGPAAPAQAGQGVSPSRVEPVEERALRLLRRVGLGDRLRHRPGQLSGGERQRVAVVRALINQPPLLLADEPTGALDRASSDSLGQLLADLNREEGVTLILVTHAPELARRTGRVLELRDGVLTPMAAKA